MTEDFGVYDEFGVCVGHVGPHPRIKGYWLAVWKPKDWRSSGLKKYKTHAGAVRHVLSEWVKGASMPHRGRAR